MMDKYKPLYVPVMFHSENGPKSFLSFLTNNHCKQKIYYHHNILTKLTNIFYG